MKLYYNLNTAYCLQILTNRTCGYDERGGGMGVNSYKRDLWI